MVYIHLASGFEEVEALTAADLLRRAGADAMLVSVTGEKTVAGAHGLRIEADLLFEDADYAGCDMIVLPGGMPGTLNLEKSRTVQDAIDYCTEKGKYIGAICAAPSVLGKKNLLTGKKATCFPGFEDFLLGAEFTGAPVELDGKIITARGAGVAVEFGLKLAAVLKGKAASDKVRAAMRCI